MGKAKLAGLFRDKTEIGGPGDSVEAVADRLLQEPVIRFRPVTDEDRQGFVDLLKRHGQEVQEPRRQRLLKGNGRS